MYDKFPIDEDPEVGVEGGIPTMANITGSGR